jgi:hypothetical protein
MSTKDWADDVDDDIDESKDDLRKRLGGMGESCVDVDGWVGVEVEEVWA